MTNQQSPSYRPSAADEAAFKRRRTHANIEGMSSLILQAVGFPSRRHRDFIAALQSVNTGEDARVPYTPFRRAHLTIAAYMQLEGSSDTKRKAVYRETVVLRAFTKRTGIILFHVTPGKEDEATTYIDYLTPAADAAAQLALSSPLWQTDKQKAKQEAVSWAVEQLPRVDPEADDPDGAPPLPVDAYEAAQDARLCRSVENVADEVARRGGDDDLWLERHIKALVKIKASRKKTAPARNDHLSLRRMLDEEREQRDAAARDGVEVGGNTAGDNSVRTPPASDQPPDVGGVRTLLSVPPAEETPASAGKEPDLGAAAVAYARRGWHVFPLHSPDPERGCTCSLGPDCKSPGKHPRTRRGLKDATTDEAQISRWWQRWPNANVGLATGRASGLVAVDVDHRAGGGAGLTQLFEEHGEFPDTLEAETGGGFHIFFAHPGVSFKNSSSVLGEGLDVKTDGGYVVAAPSLHASGKRYKWACKRRPARMPQWLLTLLTAERAKPAEAKSAKACPAGAAEGPQICAGYRNKRLFQIACAMRGSGSGKEEITAELRQVNAARCVPPLDDAEVERIAASATRYQPGSSRARSHAGGGAP